FEYQPQAADIFDFNLPEHGRVTVKRQVGKTGNEKVLVKQEVFDGLARVVSVINHDKREDGDARERVRHFFNGLWFKIKKLAWMAHQIQAKRFEILGVSFVISSDGGKARFLFR